MIISRTNNTNRTNFKSHVITATELTQLRKATKQGKAFLYNVDTTHGFMDQKGKIRRNGVRDGLPVPGADAIIPALKRLHDAARGIIPQVRSRDAHKFTDPELKFFKGAPFNSDIHSQKGTKGARNIPVTDGIPSHIIEVEPHKNDVPSVGKIQAIFSNKGIIDLEKNENSPLKYGDKKTHTTVDNKKGLDFFANLQKAGVKIAVICGVATDFCVKEAVIACKKFGIKPVVVDDAIKEIAEKSTEVPNHEVFGDVATITSKQVEKLLAPARKKKVN